jgi:PAS domain S-box-containing protein
MRIMQVAHEHFRGFGQTGEFSLARREGDLIQFLLHRRHDSLLTLKPMSAAAMQEKAIGKALSGLSGSMVGSDYRGERVLAAYEPVSPLGWDIVAKIDVSEIRAPFVKAGFLAGGAALLVILGGVGLFFRGCNPLIRRLEENEANTQAVLDTAPDGIIIFDDRRIIQSMNRAAERLFGYTADEMVGQRIDRLMPSLIGEVATDGLMFDLTRRNGVRLRGVQEMTGQHRNGTSVPTDVALSEMRVGERRLYTGIFRDIAQRKRLEAQLRQLQKMQAIGTLVGGIAHDFNNTLAAILGYTELALLKVPNHSPVRRYLKDVLTAAKRAKDLVRRILVFSRQNETERNRVRLPPLVRGALSLLRASLPSTIEIRHHIDEEIETVLADPTQIHQVLMNLGANAEYAMRKTGGVLDVRLEAVELDVIGAALHPHLAPVQGHTSG